MELSVTFNDGRTETVKPSPADLVRFERQYAMPAAHIEADPRIEYLMFLAHAALTRTKRTDLDFDAFLDELAEIDGDDGNPPQPPA